jgi:hypothetical protein
VNAAQWVAFLLGLALVVGGVAMINVVTGGRGRFGGWLMDEEARRARKARVLREHPRVGPWLVPGGYAFASLGLGLFVWAIVSA